MGKKNKKGIKTSDNHPPVTGEDKLDLENGDFDSETHTSTHQTKKSKKKRKQDLNCSLDAVPAQVNSEENVESDTPAAAREIKKKKRSKNNEQKPSEEVQNDTENNVNEEELCVPKKKKKKSQRSEDLKVESDATLEIDDQITQNGLKKNKSSSIKVVKSEEHVVPKVGNEVSKQKNKKGKKKAKTGAPVLNDEEAQVTEEDIDKFIDELGEEDNKQYEDWVKLLDARLSKKNKAE